MATRSLSVDPKWSKRCGDARAWPPIAGLTLREQTEFDLGIGATFDGSSDYVRQQVVAAEQTMTEYPDTTAAFAALVMPRIDQIIAENAVELARRADAVEAGAVIEQYQPEA